MEIIKKNPIPLYESICPECGSVFRYKACEVSLLHITCPVCGSSVSAKSNDTHYPLMNMVLRGTTQCGSKPKYAKTA